MSTSRPNYSFAATKKAASEAVMKAASHLANRSPQETKKRSGSAACTGAIRCLQGVIAWKLLERL